MEIVIKLQKYVPNIYKIAHNSLRWRPVGLRTRRLALIRRGASAHGNEGLAGGQDAEMGQQCKRKRVSIGANKSEIIVKGSRGEKYDFNRISQAPEPCGAFKNNLGG